MGRFAGFWVAWRRRPKVWAAWVLFCSVAFTASCSPKVLRLYPGPARPAHEVAHLEVPAGSKVVDVDGEDVNVPRYITELGSGDHRERIPVVEVLPGCHRMKVAYRARFRGERQVPGPNGTAAGATALLLVTRVAVVPFPVPDTHGESTEVTFSVEADFEVELRPGYKYQPFATLVGEQFTPRLVVFAPNGERLGALPAAAPDDGAGCSQLAGVHPSRKNL